MHPKWLPCLDWTLVRREFDRLLHQPVLTIPNVPVDYRLDLLDPKYWPSALPGVVRRPAGRAGQLTLAYQDTTDLRQIGETAFSIITNALRHYQPTFHPIGLVVYDHVRSGQLAIEYINRT